MCPTYWSSPGRVSLPRLGVCWLGNTDQGYQEWGPGLEYMISLWWLCAADIIHTINWHNQLSEWYFDRFQIQPGLRSSLCGGFSLRWEVPLSIFIGMVIAQTLPTFTNFYQCNVSGILHRDLKPDNILGVTNPVTGLVRWKECILIPYMFHFISLSLQK